jgi:hypothetical protein
MAVHCCRYPVDYHESLNTVLCQELVRFNRLIVTMHSSLVQLQKAIKGEHCSPCCLQQLTQYSAYLLCWTAVCLVCLVLC